MAEGSFQAEIKNLNDQVLLRFSVSLAIEIQRYARDEELIKSLVHYFNCGKVQKK
jgi:hypothetical protein